jgi:hypothetical protein
MISGVEKPRANFGGSPWQVAVCLVLGTLFLYNPFVTICMSSGPSAAFHHPVSYRSTVASSELGCSTIQHSKVNVAPIQILISRERIRLQQEDQNRPRAADEIVVVVTQDLVSGLWFRPPPSL